MSKSGSDFKLSHVHGKEFKNIPNGWRIKHVRDVNMDLGESRKEYMGYNCWEICNKDMIMIKDPGQLMQLGSIWKRADLGQTSVFAANERYIGS